MKKILFSISLIFTITISALCQADTISYWHIYLDNKLINEFSLTTDNPLVEIKESDVNRNSTLTIEYFRDTYCHNCDKYLIVRNSEDKQISKIRRSRNLNKHTLKLKRLVKMFSKGKESSFRMYFRTVPDLEICLFTLTFKK
jgi:hypothetical protein